MKLSPLVLALACLYAPVALAQDSGSATSAWAAKKSAWLQVPEGQRDEVFRFADKYKQYLGAARNAGLATAEAMKMARAAGFAELTRPDQVRAGARLILPTRDRTVVLAVIGQQPLTSGSRVVATHHDSPHIALKARPVVTGAQGSVALFQTIFYGGIKKHQWANVPLALVGKIETPDGRSIDVSIGVNPDDPVFVIGDSAPHADKDLRTRLYTDVFRGEELDPIAGSIPGAKTGVVAEVLRALKEKYRIDEEDFVSADLALVPATAPRDVGIDRGMVGAYGQDDRLSTYCALKALTEIEGTPNQTAIVYVSNFEEVGSPNNTGASSQLLSSAYARLVAGQKASASPELDLRTALRNAQVVSADTNDGINPIFPDATEASNAAKVGFGVTIKRYGGGFDASPEFIAKVRSVLDKGAIPWQTHTPKVDVGTGGTIGKFMSAQEMEVIDMGVPLISMHSTFELSSKVDVWYFYRFMKAYYQAK